MAGPLTARRFGRPVFQVGYTKVAGSAGTYTAGATCLGGPYTMPRSGYLQSLSIYSTVATGATGLLGLYDNSGAAGIPKVLLATTPSFIPVSTGWQTVYPTTNPLVLQGAVIFISVLSITTDIHGVFDSLGVSFYFDNGTTETVFPNPFVNNGAGSPFTNDSISIYATFH